MSRSLWITAASCLVAGAGAGAFTMTATQSSAAPTKPVVQTTPVCEGVGSTSFCHLTIKPDGTEWLFYEDGHGTITFLKQTPPQ